MTPGAPDAAMLAPFGTLIEAPESGARRHYSDWLAPVAGLALQFHINAVPPSALPLTLTRMEHHPHGAQAFVPMDVSRYLVTVAPDAADGGPDMGRAVSMLLPGRIGVIYRAGVWHAGVTVLDRPGHFAVMMQRGAPDDDVFAAIAPVVIGPPASGAPA